MTVHEGDLQACGKLVWATAQEWLCASNGALLRIDPYGARLTEVVRSSRGTSLTT